MDNTQYNYEKSINSNVIPEDEKRMLLRGYKYANIMGYFAIIGIALVGMILILALNYIIYVNYSKSTLFPIISSISFISILALTFTITSVIFQFKVKKVINKSNQSFAKKNMINIFENSIETKEKNIDLAEDNLSKIKAIWAVFNATSSKVDNAIAGVRIGNWHFRIRS